MSIASQIQRLQIAKSNIAEAILLKGVDVPENSKIDDFPELILLINSVDTNPNITSYIIDQRTESGYNLPDDMIIGLPAKDDDRTIEVDNLVIYKNVLKRIRANSHIYVGRYDTEGSTLRVRQVSDLDKRLWVDGNQIVIGDNDNFFMKLPQFWWKCELIIPDVFRVSFTDLEDYTDSNWNMWEGNTFIGVYGTSSSSAVSSDGIRSIPIAYDGLTGQWTAFSNSVSSLRQYGFSLVNYDAHQIMALLGLGWLGTTDSRNMLGYGWGNKTSLASLGMSDSHYSPYGSGSNFWGLEDWLASNFYETMENLLATYSFDTQKWTIKIFENAESENPIKIFTINEQNSQGNIIKLNLSQNGNVIPINCLLNSNFDRCYASYGGFSFIYVGSLEYAPVVATRSGLTSNGGLLYLNFCDSKTTQGSHIRSRLMYKGNYQIVEEL